MSEVRRAGPRSAARGPARAVPWQLRIPALVAFAFLVLPFVGLLVRAPWTDMPTLLADPVVFGALRLSLLCATLAAAASVVLGIPLAWVLARSDGRTAAVARALVTVPLVLPPVVGGVALLAALGRTGILGRPIDDAFGITLPFTSAAVVVAETFVAMPFLVITVEGAFRTLDSGLEEAATTLGSSRWRTFLRITVPTVAPALVAGTALAWARALGEFGATITFAGNSPGRTQTMPLAVYLAMERDPDAALALSVLLLAVCVGVLIALRGRWFSAVTR